MVVIGMLVELLSPERRNAATALIGVISHIEFSMPPPRGVLITRHWRFFGCCSKRLFLVHSQIRYRQLQTTFRIETVG